MYFVFICKKRPHPAPLTMNELLLSLQRSAGSLTRGRIWLYLLIPSLLASALMSALVIFALDWLVATLLEQPPMSWISTWGALWLAHSLAWLGGWLSILSAGSLLVVLLASIAGVPLMLEYLAAADYPDLARLGQDSLLASSWNSVAAALLFLLGWLLTLPLWLIPGMGLLLPLFWMAWLNRRTFAYDALAIHASHAEWQAFRRQRATSLLLLGGLMALLTHVPLLGLFAPSLAALAYIHFCLEGLRRFRRGAVTTI